MFKNCGNKNQNFVGFLVSKNVFWSVLSSSSIPISTPAFEEDDPSNYCGGLHFRPVVFPQSWGQPRNRGAFFSAEEFSVLEERLNEVHSMFVCIELNMYPGLNRAYFTGMSKRECCCLSETCLDWRMDNSKLWRRTTLKAIRFFTWLLPEEMLPLFIYLLGWAHIFKPAREKCWKVFRPLIVVR